MRHLASPFCPQEFSDPEVKAPSRLSLDKDVRELRAAVSRDVTGEELTQLTCRSNTNHAYWATASSLEDARFLVGLSYDAGLKLGFSMSPIWLEVSKPIRPPIFSHSHPPSDPLTLPCMVEEVHLWYFVCWRGPLPRSLSRRNL